MCAFTPGCEEAQVLSSLGALLPLKKKIKDVKRTKPKKIILIAGPTAFGRLYLDNFPHVGASWFGEGKEIGIKSLGYGADDFGGTIMEENVHRATEWINQANHADMLRMIRQAGFEPAQRDAFYNVIKTYEEKLAIASH